MKDKCILKVKINPMRSCRFHGICRIKVMMTAFQATLYTSTIKLQAKGKNCLLDYNKRRNKDKTTEQVLAFVFELVTGASQRLEPVIKCLFLSFFNVSFPGLRFPL